MWALVITVLTVDQAPSRVHLQTVIDTDDVNPKGKVRTGVTTNLSLKHLNSNSAVRITGADNDAAELHRSEIEADLQLSVYHKVLRCKHQLNQSVRSE